MGTDLSPLVGYPACEADHPTKIVQGRQRYKKAEGCSLAKTHKNDPTGIGATMNLSLNPSLHMGDGGCYGDLIPLVAIRRK